METDPGPPPTLPDELPGVLVMGMAEFVGVIADVVVEVIELLLAALELLLILSLLILPPLTLLPVLLVLLVLPKGCFVFAVLFGVVGPITLDAVLNGCVCGLKGAEKGAPVDSGPVINLVEGKLLTDAGPGDLTAVVLGFDATAEV